MMVTKRALVIQKNIVINKILEGLMNSKGFDCNSLYSIDDLKAKTFHPVYDIVITDLLFNGIRPIDYINELSSLISYRQVIIVTALGQDKIKRRIMQSLKIDGYYDFPVDLDLIQT